MDWLTFIRSLRFRAPSGVASRSNVCMKSEDKMSLPARVALAVLLALTLVPEALARNEVLPSTVQGLVAFASDEGLARLARADGKVDFPALANQFEAQSNVAFCGPSTVAIVLNAVRGRSPDLPRDRSQLHPKDLQYLPSGFDLTVPRYTQDNVIGKGQKKTRAQVLGEPVTPRVRALLCRFPGGSRSSLVAGRLSWSC